MGVVNVTPDSFSDGGLFVDREAAVAHAALLADEGADLVDVGGESTRPGAAPVPVDEEIERVVPVIEGVRAARPGVAISVDTRRSEVAQAALGAGAHAVNDVSAGADPAMFPIVREARAGMVLMHMRGDPRTMQDDPRYDDVVGEVHEALRERVEAALFAGLGAEQVAIDPGIGFGKDLGHNLELLRRLDAFTDLDAALVLGVSRKRFIGTITGIEDPADRVEGSVAAAIWGAAHGADVVRVHDVAATVRALAVTDAIARGRDVIVTEGGPRDADAVVLLHGWPGGVHTWRRLAPLLATRFRVLTPALAGTDPLGSAADVRAALAERGVTRFALVGHGHGGGVAQLVADGDPGTKALVLIDSVAFDVAPPGDLDARTFVERGSVEIADLPAADLDAYAGRAAGAPRPGRPDAAHRRDGVVGLPGVPAVGRGGSVRPDGRRGAAHRRMPRRHARGRARQRALPARRRLRPGGRDDPGVPAGAVPGRAARARGRRHVAARAATSLGRPRSVRGGR